MESSESNVVQVMHRRRNSLPYQAPESYFPVFPPEIIGMYSNHGIEPGAQDTIVKRNQDRGSLEWPFAGDEGQVLFGVFDGHGELGDLVSQSVMDQLHSTLSDQLVKQEAEGTPADLPTILKDTFKDIDARLRVDREIDTSKGGTTASVALYARDSRSLTVAFVGDSRVVLGRREGRLLKAVPLTEDHKPDLPRERKRIERVGGIVKMGDEYTSTSVWLPDESEGLCMSRSIGDRHLHKCGVSADPDVMVHNISDYDEVLIAASDGIWEMLSNEAAIDIAYSSKSATDACVALIKAASEKWQESEGAYRDDVTALVVKLPPLERFLAEQHEGTLPSERSKSCALKSEQESAEELAALGSAPPPSPSFQRRNSIPMQRLGARRGSFTMAPDMDLTGTQLSPGPPKEPPQAE